MPESRDLDGETPLRLLTLRQLYHDAPQRGFTRFDIRNG
jgi:hypothetical protein